MGVISTKANFDEAVSHIEKMLKTLKDDLGPRLSNDARAITASMIASQVLNISIGRDLYLQLERTSKTCKDCKCT